MRVLISSTRFSGHLNPLLSYADALIAKGHEVAVAAPEATSRRLAQAGIVHLPVRDPAEENTEASRRIGGEIAGMPAAEAAVERMVALAARPGAV